jgi:hypothetical protein
VRTSHLPESKLLRPRVANNKDKDGDDEEEAANSALDLIPSSAVALTQW